MYHNHNQNTKGNKATITTTKLLLLSVKLQQLTKVERGSNQGEKIWSADYRIPKGIMGEGEGREKWENGRENGGKEGIKEVL